MKTICPPPLKQGLGVSVVAPAGPVDPLTLEKGLRRLSSRYTSVLSDGCMGKKGYLSGPDERRLLELQGAINDKDTLAVIAARGGYGVSRIIDGLDLSELVQSPKWIVGSSDVTALLLHCWIESRIQTIHGPMVSGMADSPKEDLDGLFDLLEGRAWDAPSHLTSIFPGRARGPLVGGNLTVLAHLSGTFDPICLKGAILFLEDIGEHPYRLDRCITQLKRARMLEDVGGVVLGDFTDCEPGSHGITAFQAVVSNLKSLRVPVIGGYPAAHGKRNYPFVHGREVEIEAGQESASISN